MNTEFETCPKCGAEVKDCPGIGPYCPNENCSVLDALDMDAAAMFQDGQALRNDAEMIWRCPAPQAPADTNYRQLILGVHKVTVVRRSYSADTIFITFEGKPPLFPFNQLPKFTLDVEQGEGVEYVRSVFGVEPDEVIDA